MSLPPILYHYFHTPLPYTSTLALQERLHRVQQTLRHTSSHPDLLLLLQHRPVYTAGRRQSDSSVTVERARLAAMGADFALTQRGGQLTYHGPGQLVGYPLLDLGRTTESRLTVREYVCRMQRMLGVHLERAHGLHREESAHTGVFIDARTKIASIGVQVRHRLTTHGFALNVTREPLPWFEHVVACGLEGVRAGCIETAAERSVEVSNVAKGMVETFGNVYERDMEKLEVESAGEIGDLILALEEEAKAAGDWSEAPR